MCFSQLVVLSLLCSVDVNEALVVTRFFALFCDSATLIGAQQAPKHFSNTLTPVQSHQIKKPFFKHMLRPKSTVFHTIETAAKHILKASAFFRTLYTQPIIFSCGP